MVRWLGWLDAGHRHTVLLTLNLDILARLDAALVGPDAVLLWRRRLDLERDGRRVGVVDEERALHDDRERA